MTHAALMEPAAPGTWIDPVACECGARYEDFRGPYSFTEARDAAKLHNGNADDWFPSRGPVLWFMRCAKLREWYEAHYACGVLQHDQERAIWEEMSCEHLGKS